MIGQKNAEAVLLDSKRFMHGTTRQLYYRTTMKVSAAFEDVLRRNGQAS
jgi:hypothetical protein